MKNIEIKTAENLTVKDIFDWDVDYVNPRTSTISSLGTFSSEMQKQVAWDTQEKLLKIVPEESLAHKILSSDQETFSMKQRWVICYELIKNKVYCKELADYINEINKKEAMKREYKRQKRQAKKAKKLAMQQATLF